MYVLLGIALILALITYEILEIENKKDKLDDPFVSRRANFFYHLSFMIPFKWFIDEKGIDKKTREIKRNIADANLNEVFNYRSYMAFRVLLLITSIFLVILLYIVFTKGDVLFAWLLNLPKTSLSHSALVKNNIKNLLTVAIFTLTILNFMPNLYLRHRAEQNRTFNLREAPLIQMFIILMLRSKKTLSEILFALTKVNTRYRSVFNIGYRRYLRNKEEGFEYIKKGFENTSFDETIIVLKDMENYSHEESIHLLENKMEQMVEQVNTTKRRKNISDMIYSQGSILFPFIAVLLLGGFPIIALGISIFENAAGM